MQETKLSLLRVDIFPSLQLRDPRSKMKYYVYSKIRIKWQSPKQREETTLLFVGHRRYHKLMKSVLLEIPLFPIINKIFDLIFPLPITCKGCSN
jgi:hypothetical protein